MQTMNHFFFDAINTIELNLFWVRLYLGDKSFFSLIIQMIGRNFRAIDIMTWNLIPRGLPFDSRIRVRFTSITLNVEMIQFVAISILWSIPNSRLASILIENNLNSMPFSAKQFCPNVWANSRPGNQNLRFFLLLYNCINNS
jgi:hypothetical protein